LSKTVLIPFFVMGSAMGTSSLKLRLTRFTDEVFGSVMKVGVPLTFSFNESNHLANEIALLNGFLT